MTVEPTPTLGDLEGASESPTPKGSANDNGVAVSIESINYSVSSKKKDKIVILDGITASFAPGKMTALMGPSGCGKTTLLDVVAGRKNSGTITGDIKYGGVSPKKEALKHCVGYVEQFDTLVGELTVRQMLMYTAELRLPTTVPTKDKVARVDETIARLDLSSCTNTVIGNALQRGISGGQAKRVNLALSLIMRPSVIYLDEPTSGLDSHMANEVADCLRSLADEGRTIVCTIHSPTAYAFGRFDDLLMLKAGKVTYSGELGAAARYFERVAMVKPPSGFFSLPEYLVDLTSNGKYATVSKDVDFRALWAKSEEAATMGKLVSAQANSDVAARLVVPASMPGQLKQLATLLRFRMTTHYQNGEFLGPRIGDKIIFGLLILSLYWGIGDDEDTSSIQSTASLLYFISALCGYGAAAFVPSLTLDRPLYYRELADGCYTPLVYYMSKFVEEAVLAVFTSLLFACITFFGCQLQGSFWVFAGVYYLTTMCGICLAYAVAAIAPNMDAANAMLPTYVTTCMYFGGLFLLFDEIPIGWYWFSWTSFLRYSWGAQMLNQYSDSAVGRYPAYVTESGPVNVLDFYGMKGDIMGSLGACVGLLALLVLIFATCGAFSIAYIRHATR